MGYAGAATFNGTPGIPINGDNACYIMYDRSANAIYLTDDQSPPHWIGGYAPTTSNTIQNNQCAIDVGQTTVTSLFDTLTVRPMLTFKTNLNGARNLYLYAFDNYGQASGWSQVGTWTVAGSPLTISTPTLLPDAMANVPYNPFVFKATGGAPPYTWTVISGLPPGMSLSPDTLYGTPTAIIPPQLTVKVTDSANQSVTKVFSLTVNGSSPVLVTASPTTRSIAPGASAGYTILVNGGTGFTGTVSFSTTGLPGGAAAGFSPSVSGSGTTNLTITTAMNTSAGTFPIKVNAQNGALSYSTTILLTVSSLSAAKVITPAPGALLLNSTSKFTWDSGVNASQYQLSLGSSAGASDYYFANTGLAQSTIASLPSGSTPRTIYVTLSSLISGTWQSSSYTYRVGSTATLVPKGVVQMNPAYYVLNDNVPLSWPYCLKDYTGLCSTQVDAGTIDPESITVSCPGVSARITAIPSTHDPYTPSSFDLEYTANHTAAPGPCTVSLAWVAPCTDYGGGAAQFEVPCNDVPEVWLSLPGGVHVYDATPVITGIQQNPAASDGSFYVELYGTNLGPSPGSVAMCAQGAQDPCNGTADISSVITGAGPTQQCPYCTWTDTQVNVLVVPTSSAAGFYDMQLTSGGEAQGLGFQPAAGQSNSKSNRVQPVVISVRQGVSLWFFGTGNSVPPTFTLGDIKTVLTASGAGAGTFAWTITRGANKVSFTSGSSQATITTSTNSVTLWSIGYSTDVDVTVSVVWTSSGGTTYPAAARIMAVDSPYKLVADPSGIVNSAISDCSVPPTPGTVGFQTLIPYRIISFFGTTITNVNLNEQFPPLKTDIYIPNYWAQYVAGSLLTSGATFVDDICYTYGSPLAKVPQSPLSSTVIDYNSQTWFIGSLTIGGGLPVQTDRLTRYIDHGTHTIIVSPVR